MLLGGQCKEMREKKNAVGDLPNMFYRRILCDSSDKHKYSLKLNYMWVEKSRYSEIVMGMGFPTESIIVREISGIYKVVKNMLFIRKVKKTAGIK